ncbi:RNA polymerase sigma factor [Sphingobacterium sp. BIGb0165]|uniref:RNA polymerase sigma factor n=1 Tax=Sphingobacterium sp. BIGb0165 TaxID=2940615 RepID=UPI00216701EF|nr:RNA polymerase sigma-70 factor [Sphingobacterium sp. BIGb0165]MCS4229032.1 RNA polymerase sigma-70 factor (ECF subfamily) [Sphingobacterium sp. BIGb0165]
MQGDQIKEEHLFQLIKAGDHTAFALLFHQYKEVLFRHAYQILRDLDETEDVVQELFAEIWEKRAQLPELAYVSSYLYRATRNKVLNKLNRGKVIDKYLDHVIQNNPPFHEQTESWILEKELRAIIEQEIAHLPERMRHIFQLSRQEGLSHKEIAALLNISEGTSKLQVSNALKILKSKLLKAIVVLIAG